jgi:hypothetical protein
VNERIDALDERFTDLLSGCRPSGGLARDNEIAARVVARHPGGFVWLARHIASRELLFFAWRDALWFPVFQFDRTDMSLRHSVARVSAELTGWTDDWERVHWFVRPHCALVHRTPIELVDAQPERVMEVARMERYLHNA